MFIQHHSGTIAIRNLDLFHSVFNHTVIGLQIKIVPCISPATGCSQCYRTAMCNTVSIQLNLNAFRTNTLIIVIIFPVLDNRNVGFINDLGIGGSHSNGITILNTLIRNIVTIHCRFFYNVANRNQFTVLVFVLEHIFPRDCPTVGCVSSLGIAGMYAVDLQMELNRIVGMVDSAVCPHLLGHHIYLLRHIGASDSCLVNISLVDNIVPGIRFRIAEFDIKAGSGILPCGSRTNILIYGICEYLCSGIRQNLADAKLINCGQLIIVTNSDYRIFGKILNTGLTASELLIVAGPLRPITAYRNRCDSSGRCVCGISH